MVFFNIILQKNTVIIMEEIMRNCYIDCFVGFNVCQMKLG